MAGKTTKSFSTISALRGARVGSGPEPTFDLTVHGQPGLPPWACSETWIHPARSPETWIRLAHTSGAGASWDALARLWLFSWTEKEPPGTGKHLSSLDITDPSSCGGPPP